MFFQDTTDRPFDACETIDGDHGRIETRQYVATSDIDWLPGKHLWAGIKTIVMVIRRREVNEKAFVEMDYFISSLDNHAPTIAKAIREHWGIENGLHWWLNIAFREDYCRVRKEHAPENFGIIRHMAINLLKHETSLKGGIQTKRLKAAWDHDYMRLPCDPTSSPLRLAGKRLMVVSYMHDVDWIFEIAFNLCMIVEKVGILNYTQDHLFRTRFRGWFELETGYTPRKRDEDLARMKPDLLLCNYVPGELPVATHVDGIPLCPDVGFLGGLAVARRWAALLKAPIREGWRDDGDATA